MVSKGNSIVMGHFPGNFFYQGRLTHHVRGDYKSKLHPDKIYHKLPHLPCILLGPQSSSLKPSTLPKKGNDKLPYNCSNFTCQQGNAQNLTNQASTVHEPRTSSYTIQLEPDLEKPTDSKSKGICQGCVFSPCLFNLYAEYIMQNARLDE